MKKLFYFSKNHIFFLIAGNMIGVGVFITPNWAASQTNSPLNYIIAWVIGAIIAICGGISYAVLTKTFPQNGGDYFYLKRTSNKIIAWIFASAMLWFVFPGSIASLSIGAANYFEKILYILIPGDSFPKEISLILAMLFVLVFLIVNLNKYKIAISTQKIISITLIICMVTFLILSKTFINETVDIFHVQKKVSTNWLSAILAVYFSYIGFASIGYVAKEINLSFKTLRKWTVISIIAVSCLYLALNIFYIKLIPFQELQNEMATIFLITKNLPTVINVIILFAICLAALGSLNVVMLTGSRLFEFVFNDISQKKNTNIFNWSLFLMTFLGLIYMFTNSFEKILAATTWSILIFSFVTMFSFSIYILKKKQLFIQYSKKVIFAIITFTLCTGILSIYGFIKFSSFAFTGIIYITIGFVVVFLLFYLLSLRKSNL